jgi:hypothetical protein
MELDLEFDNADAGASLCVPVASGSVKLGHVVMIKEHPCKVRFVV